MATLLPGQPEDRDPSVDRGLIHSQTGAPQTWVNTDFYAQVSNVMPSGGVVLSPGQQLRIQENREEVTHKKGSKGENSSNENAEKQDLQIQLLVVVPESAENNVRQMSTPPTSPMPSEVYHTVPLQTVDPKPVEEQQSPYILPDSTQSPLFAPVADYTVVQEVDSRHSLLLNPPPHQSPPPCLPQHPLKSLPAMPLGYVIPDLLGNLSLWNDSAKMCLIGPLKDCFCPVPSGVFPEGKGRCENLDFYCIYLVYIFIFFHEMQQQYYMHRSHRG